MKVTFIWCFALGLCLAATLVLGVASLFTNKKGWPSDKEEKAVLGVKKEAYKKFCLSVRDQIKEAAGDSELNARVFNLMADFSEGSRKMIDAGRKKARKIVSRMPKAPISRNSYVLDFCGSRLDSFYLATLNHVVRDRMQIGVYSVCNKTMQSLWDSLGDQLRDFKGKQKIPDELRRYNLEDIGCKSVTRLNDAIVGCRWFGERIRDDTPFIVDPDKMPERKGRRYGESYVFIQLERYEEVLKSIRYPK